MPIFQKLTETDKEIALATCGLTLRALLPDDFLTKMNTLIAKTYLKTSFTYDSIQVGQTIRELCDDITRYFPSATFEEIELAFKSGYKEEYGQYFGLNNKTYFMWIGAYFHGVKRANVKKTLLEAKEKEKQPEVKKSQEEVDIILKEACLKSFDDFRLGVLVLDAGNVKYNYLERIGVLNLSKERKLEIFKTAEAMVKAEAIESKGKSDTIEKALSRILPDTIKSEAKKEALRVFFKDLTEQEMELSELLD